MQSTSSRTSHFGLRAVLRKIWEMIQAQLQVWWAQSPTVSHRWNQHQNTSLCFPSLTILSNMTDNVLIIVTSEHLLCVLRLFAQSCLTLCDSKDCSPPGSSVHGESPGKSGLPCPPPGDLPSLGIPGLPHCRWLLYHLSHQGSPRYILNYASIRKFETLPWWWPRCWDLSLFLVIFVQMIIHLWH